MSQKFNNFTIPLSVIVAGALIAGAIMFSNSNSEPSVAQKPTPQPTKPSQPQQVASTDNIKPVSDSDHIRGDVDAPVKIVEYTDFECPFCKRFHNTMNQVMDEYGENGKVAWVLRQFPLEQLHPVKAKQEAVATECAAKLGGNDAFWAYSDRFFEVTPSNNRTDTETVLPQIAKEIGLDVEAFNTCLTSGEFDAHISEDIQDAVATGGRGTPWSVLIGPDGTTYPINGAQPYASIKQMIEIALEK